MYVSLQFKMMIPICVGHAPNWASRVGRGEHASCLGAEHDHLLYASDTQLEGMIPVCIGHAGSGDDFRHRIEQVSQIIGCLFIHLFMLISQGVLPNFNTRRGVGSMPLFFC